MFVTHDLKCDDCEVYLRDHFVRRNEMHEVPCPECGGNMRILPCVTRLDWQSLAQGDSASPEAIARFDRVHRQQAEREKKLLREHGDRGRTPGS